MNKLDKKVAKGIAYNEVSDIIVKRMSTLFALSKIAETQGDVDTCNLHVEIGQELANLNKDILKLHDKLLEE